MSRSLVTQYQAEVEKIIRYGGSKQETSIRNAFERLLSDCCKPRNYMLNPELDFKTKFNTTGFPDGMVKDAIRLEHGCWESKDQYDKLDEDIEKKLEKGYPDESILFEDSQTLISIDPSDLAKPIKRTTPKAKLKADKAEGKVILDTETTLEGIPSVAWDYKLGNRSVLEWILDQCKEKTPPTIAKLFNTYKFANYKEQVINLLWRGCTVSVRTMEIIQQTSDTVEHKRG